MKEKIATMNTEISVVETLEKLNLSNKKELSFDEIKNILKVYIADNWDNYHGDGKNVFSISHYIYPEQNLPVFFMYNNNNGLEVVKLEQETYSFINICSIYGGCRKLIHKGINFGNKGVISEYWNRKINKEGSTLIGVTEIVPKNKYSDSEGSIIITSIELEKAAYIGNECFNYLKQSGYLSVQQSKQYHK